MRLKIGRVSVIVRLIVVIIMKIHLGEELKLFQSQTLPTSSTRLFEMTDPTQRSAKLHTPYPPLTND